MVIINGGPVGIWLVHNSHSLGVPITVPTRVLLLLSCVPSSLSRVLWDGATTLMKGIFAESQPLGPVFCLPGPTCASHPGGFQDKSTCHLSWECVCTCSWPPGTQVLVPSWQALKGRREGPISNSQVRRWRVRTRTGSASKCPMSFSGTSGAENNYPTLSV